MSYTINTAKGTHTGNLRSVCAWQAEMQGSMATITTPDGLEVDVDAIDFDGDDLARTIADVEAAISAATRTTLALDELEDEEEAAGLEAALEEARAARDEEAERQAWDGQDDAEEVARMLSPGQAWEQYVGDQTVAEWVANDGPTDTDGLEEYLAQTWPRDTTETARPIIARRLADYIVAQS